MTTEKTKTAIREAIQAFTSGDLTHNSLALFKTLGYNTERQAPLDNPTYSMFKEAFISDKPFNEAKAKTGEWKHVDLLFQLTKEEILQQTSLFDTGKVDQTIIETYLFFGIELSGENYTRTELSQITREINRLFPMPAMILFKNGNTLTLSVINRRLHKRDETKDVLEKVTLIKDINIAEPHRAHIEILYDLSFVKLQHEYSFSNFVELHNAWQKTLDTKELNKKFYNELANWYFWAMEHAQFPDDFDKNTDIRNATNLIRLITRVIFIWFIKEKHLVPEQIFERKFINEILKDFLISEKSHNYYNAILQNLFFGTLNQTIEKRKFADEGDISVNVREYGVKTLFRYSGMFKISKAEVIDLFKEIPFLNGGLFDCLDKTDTHGKVIYGDGFSRNSNKRATIPDFLFFGDEKEVDLNKVFGTKNKKYSTKGLINLLTGYKFTITENTPIEEEVALDPELLGKTFENLLASYNPDTQTTARKQTGSFYTPREIVNYMVDESLIEYLRQAVNDMSEEFETQLRDLLAYNEIESPFPEPITRKLIKALNQCKILDPACGSGAFPMGILHKMVHVLQKLDPDNSYWRELQEHKAIAETKEAYKIGDQKKRDQRLTEISDVFENNTSDYGRKLYLIENCIYGVDIQPIAVQISKLRFFISLVIDQKPDLRKENYGIRSLPNLETKFVAANTLIGLEVPTADLFTAQNPIEKLQNELKATLHAYFNARNREEKLRLQEDDSRIRNGIAAMISETLMQNRESDINRLESQLEKYKAELNQLVQKPEDKEIIENTNLLGEVETTVYNKGESRIKKLKAQINKLENQIETLKSPQSRDPIEQVAKQIASFNPYDQNQFAGWFEPEWMFGISKGFDVLIGNPPWGAKLSAEDKELFKGIYPEIDSSTPNSFAYFIGWAMKNYKAVISYILPDSILIKDYAKTRKLIKDHILEIHWYENSGIPEEQRLFVYVDHDVCVISILKYKIPQLSYSLFRFDRNTNKINETRLCQDKTRIILEEFDFAFNLIAQEKDLRILDKIKRFECLNDFMQCHEGIHTGNSRDLLFVKNKSCTSCHPLFFGASAGDIIENYTSTTSGWHVDYRTEIIDRSKGFYASLRDERIFIFPKIYITRTGNPFKAFYDDNTFASNNFFSLQHIDYSKNNEILLKFILPFIISKIAQYFIRTFAAPRLGSAFIETKIFHLLKFRVPQLLDNKKALILSLVNKIITTKQSYPYADTSSIENRIDELVFKLYDLTYEEVKVIAPDFWLSEEEYEGVKIEEESA